MAIEIIVPPSLGTAKATARAEGIQIALARDLGEPVTAVVADSYADLEERAARGLADIVWCPAGVCARLPAARHVLTIVRGGQATHRSALVARKADRLTTATLSRKRAAWVDPLSAGGYLLAVSLLEGRGIALDAAFSSQKFVGSHREVIEALLDNQADVGAVFVPDATDEHVTSTLKWYSAPAGDRLEAIAISDSCPSDAIVLPQGENGGDVEAIARAGAIRDRLLQAGDRAPRFLAGLEAEALRESDLAVYRRAFVRSRSLRPPA